MKRNCILMLMAAALAVVGIQSASAFPPPGTDTVTTSAEISLYDPDDPTILQEVIVLEGTAQVTRGAEYDPGDGRLKIDTEMDLLNLRGFSTTFGDSIFATLAPSPPSVGAIQQQTPGLDFPADSWFEVHYQIGIGAPASKSADVPSATGTGTFGYDPNLTAAKAEFDVEIQAKPDRPIIGTTISPFEGSVAEAFPLDESGVNKDPNLYCTAEWMGPTGFIINNWFTGNESYAVYQDPSETGCPAVYPFEVKVVRWIVANNSGAPLPVDIQPIIFDVDRTDPLCPKPGDTICAGDFFTLTIPEGGAVISLPIDCCVEGPYFAGMFVPQTFGTGILDIVIDDTVTVPPRECANYNHYQDPEGFEDLVVVYSFPGNLRLWSEGFNRDANECFGTVLVPEEPPIMRDTIWQIPPDGRQYVDPRKTPIIDPITGAVVGYVWHKHTVNPPPGGVDTLVTCAFVEIIYGPNPPVPGQPPDDVLKFDGPTIVNRANPQPGPTGQPTVQTEIVAMDLTGFHPELGAMQLTLDPAMPPAPGEAVSLGEDQFWPMDSFFDIWYVVHMIDLGFQLKPEPSQPPHLTAVPHVEALPPFNRNYEDQNYTPAYDPLNPSQPFGWIRPIHWVKPPEGAVGACCNTVTGGCRVTTPADCNGPDEVYQGDGTTCVPNPCPQPPKDEDCFESEGRGTITLDPADNLCLNGIEIDLTSIFSPATSIEVDPPPYATGQTIETEIVALELTSIDPTLGSVIIRERDDKESSGQITNVVTDGAGNLTSGDSFFDIWVEVELPDQGLILNTDVPIHLEATISELPPIQTPYFPPPSEPPVMLLDKFTGVHIGWICHAEHLPTVQVPCDEQQGACCDTLSHTCRISNASDCNGPDEVYQGDGTSCFPNPCRACTEWTPGFDTIQFSQFEIELYDNGGALVEVLQALGVNMVVQRGAPFEDMPNRWRMNTQVVEFSGSGYSQTLGAFDIALDPNATSHGYIKQCDSCSDNWAESFFDIIYVITTDQPFPMDTLRGDTAKMELPCSEGWNPFPGGVFTPPYGHEYVDPRLVPVFDNNGQIIGYVFKRHRVQDTPPQLGACCVDQTICVVASPSECAAIGGSYQGDGTLCDPNPCQQDTSSQDCFDSEAQGTITLDPGDNLCLNGIDLDLTSLLTAPATVERDPGPYSDGQTIQTEIVALELTANDPVLGDVIVRERDDKQSLGEISNVVTDGGGNFTGGDSFFDVFIEIELPDLCMLLNTGDVPIRLEAYITELPPIDTPYIPPPSNPPIMLLDAYTSVHVGWICHAEHRPTIPIPCDTGLGACCDLATGGCRITTQADCNGPTELYQGDGTSCVPYPCRDTCTDWTAGLDTIPYSTFEVELFGTDSTLAETLIAYGQDMIVQRSAPYEVQANLWQMDTDILQFGGAGTSPTLGDFQIALDPSASSGGWIRQCDCCVDSLAQSFFDIIYVITTDQPPPMDTLRSDTAKMRLPCDAGWDPGSDPFLPPFGHTYVDPRLVPVYDNDGNLVGYVKKKHRVRENPPDTGACCVQFDCFGGGTHGDCLGLGGTYQGDNTECTPDLCADCCNGDGIRGNVDDQVGPAGEVDVGDLSYLVDFLFRAGPAPPCEPEGNVDGLVGPGGPIDVADLSYLVDFLFRGGPPPPECP